VRWTRKIGLSALGIRALPYLLRAGAKIIRESRTDLVFLSTTMFHTMALGRLWKRKSGVPFVLDIQDPWVNDYAAGQPAARSGIKHRAARRLHGLLEPWTMRVVDGIVAVSESYHVELRRRYPWIRESNCLTLPFGASSLDFELAGRADPDNPFFTPGAGLIHGVYAGCLGTAMRFACRAICQALRAGLSESPDLFRRVRLHFIGTDYAAGDRARETIRPIAAELGVADLIQEQPHRVPYFSALNLLKQADFLLVPGSDDPGYTASKTFPYILAGKPLLAVFHESSSVVGALRETGAGDVVTFRNGEHVEGVSRRVFESWAELLHQLPFTPDTDWNAFEPYTAREMTRRLCGLFNRIIDGTTAAGELGASQPRRSPEPSLTGSSAR
jgi:hypothetical protein